MRDKHTGPAQMSDKTKSIEQAMSRAVRHALLTHKRAGNTVAAWKDGRVVLINSDSIKIEEPAKGRQK